MTDRIPVGDLVAVYGSLRHGLGNHHVIAPAERLEDGIIRDQFRMVSLSGFPGLIEEGTATDIVVEVYKVTEEGTARYLDMLEGYPTFYDRKQVELVDGRVCWVYFLDEEYASYPPVPSGDWYKFKT